MKQVKKSIREESRVLFFISFFIILFFLPELTGGKVFIERDALRYYIPLWQFGVDAVKAGILPFWNPYIFGGTSFLANTESCVLYPPLWVFFFTGVTVGFNAFVTGHVLLAAWAMYAWMRDLKAGPWGAAVGALVYALSGFTLSLVHLTIALTAVAYFPLVMLCFRRFFTGGSFGWCLATALALCLMFLAGDPSVTAITLLALGGFTLFRVLEEALLRRRILWAVPLRSAAVVGLFLALGAFQIWPFYEKVQASVHTSLSYSFATLWSVPWHHLAGIVLPFIVLGDKGTLSHMEGQYWITNYHLGTLTVILAAAAFIHGRDRRVQLSLLLLVIGIALALGRYGFWYKILHMIVPFADAIRYPVRYFFLAVFAAGTLAGLGFDFLFTQEPRRKSTRVRTILLAVALTAVLVPFGFQHSAVLGWLHDRHLLSFIHSFQWFFFILAAAFVGIYLYLQNKIRRSLAIGFVGALFLFDMSSGVTGMFVTTEHEKVERPTDNVMFLAGQKGLFRTVISPWIFEVSRHRSIEETYDAYMLRARDQILANDNVRYRIQTLHGYDSIKNTDYLDYMTAFAELGPRRTVFMDLANARYLVSKPGNTPLKAEGLRLTHKNPNANIYENLNVLPRAFLVRAAETAPSSEEAVRRIREDETFRPRETVLLTTSEEVTHPQEGKRADGIPDPGEVRVTRYGLNEVILEAASPRAQWLYLADAHDRNWRASVNGRSVPVYQANGLFRAVPVPAGRFEARFYYFPFSFYAGSGVSLTSLALAILFLLRKHRKKPFKTPRATLE